MEYKCVSFDPSIGRATPSETVSSNLDKVISSEASSGWEFVGLQNHSTVVPGSNGCFGFGATSPYEHTYSVAVFRK